MIRRIWLVFWLLFSATILALPRTADAQDEAPLVLVLDAEGTVAPAMAEYLSRGIHTAEKRGAELLILQLNTPGGMLGSMERMMQDIRNSHVPVVVYVAPVGAMAASAGTIITLAGHAAAMAPESAIGAASPVSSEGTNLDSTSEAKAVNFMKATVRSLAERRGPQVVALAEQTIESAKALSASEALDTGFVDFIAWDINHLLSQLDGFTVVVDGNERVLHTAGAKVETIPLSLIERLLQTLTDPNIVFLLLNIGVVAIIIELASPGGWVAGFIGVVCLALATYGLGILSVNWFGLIFLIAAFVLFVLDIKATSHGALTIAGTVSLIVGALVLFNSPGTPSFQRVSVPLVIVTASLAAGAFLLFLIFAITPLKKLRSLTGKESLVGRLGIARTELTPRGGHVQVGGELWTARLADGDMDIPPGTRVKVVSLEGIHLQVQKVS